MMMMLLLLLLCDVVDLSSLSLFRKGGSSEVSRKAEKSALFYESSFETFSSKGKKGLKNTALKVHTPSRESDTERERDDDWEHL